MALRHDIYIAAVYFLLFKSQIIGSGELIRLEQLVPSIIDKIFEKFIVAVTLLPAFILGFNNGPKLWEAL